MSTHANIGTIQNGELVYIYLHFDGYPSHTLTTLKSHYNSQELADQLISMGDMSVLDNTIESSIFYARDRGEKKVINKGESNFTNCEYAYIFNNGEWNCSYEILFSNH